MLAEHQEARASQTVSVHASGPSVTSEVSGNVNSPDRERSLLARALRIEWLGQTVASLCWIASVLTYGISSGGDWLQLCAASAWLVANMASLTPAGDD